MSRHFGANLSTRNSSTSPAGNCIARNGLARNFRNCVSRSKPLAFVLYYTMGVMIILCGFCSFAVDYGRVQLAKTELRRAADSAARAAAAELPDANSAISFAVSYVSKNTVDGASVVLNPATDIEFGKWDTTKAKGSEWTKLTGAAAGAANCIHVTLRREAARGTGLPLLFGKVLGKGFCDVHAESYVMLIPAVNVDQNVPATANPFLSGMPRGSTASNNNPHHSVDTAGSGSAPKQSPLAVAMPIMEGDVLNFDSISGDARHDPSMTAYSPDGELTDIGHNIDTTDGSAAYRKPYYNENGIADMTAPINALVGVFLDDSQPNTSAAPNNLDFSTAASRDFTQLSPKLKQIFFIGDGLTSDGVKQGFVVPEGATRLYLATWDFYEWNNNSGQRNIRVQHPPRIITVK